jgi:hypothetical protein
VDLSQIAALPDFVLVPKHEEKQFCQEQQMINLANNRCFLSQRTTHDKSSEQKLIKSLHKQMLFMQIVGWQTFFCDINLNQNSATVNAD